MAFADFLSAFNSMEEGSEKQKLSSINTLLLGILKNAFLTRSKLFETYYKDMISLCVKDKMITNKDSLTHDDHHQDVDDHNVLDVEDIRRIHTMDLWIVYGVCSNSKLIVKLHTLVARLWMAGVLNCTHLYTSMHLHAHPLMDFFPSILSLAQCTLASTRLGHLGSCAANFGLNLYKIMYEQFPSAMCRQQIIANLIEHISSPQRREIDMAFRALTMISNMEEEERFSRSYSSTSSKVTLRKHFKSFLITLLDDVLRLSQDQQRVVFRLVFRCTVDTTVENTPSSMASIMQSSSSSSSAVASSTLNVTVSDNVIIYLCKLSTAVNPKIRKVNKAFL